METRKLFPMNVTSLGVSAEIWQDGKWHVMSHCAVNGNAPIRQHDTYGCMLDEELATILEATLSTVMIRALGGAAG
jgi:hypothetical protein